MREQANMVPIAVLTTDICDNFGDTDRKYFGEHMKNIIATYKFLHMFITNNVNVKSVTLSPDNIMDLPCDFVRETKIGVINPFGRIATMSLDRNLRVSPQCATNSQVDNALCQINDGVAAREFFPFYNHYDPVKAQVGQLLGYSCAVNRLGYFNVDRESGILIAQPPKIAQDWNIVMEYISDGISEGLKLVPTEMTAAITSRSKAMFCLDKKDSRYPTYQDEYENIDVPNLKKLYKVKPIDIYAQLFKTLNTDPYHALS